MNETSGSTAVVSSPAQRARGELIDERGQVGLLRHCATLGIEIDGAVPVETVQRAVNRVVDRHPALRSTFPDGWDSHLVRAHLPVTVTTVIVVGQDPDARWEQATRLAREDAMRPFDLRNGPLMRATLLSVDTRRHLLVLSFDQLVIDAHSSVLIVAELVEDAHLIETGADLPPVRVDGYHRVRDDHDAWLRSPAGLRATEHRRAALEGTTPGLSWMGRPDSDDEDLLGYHTVALPDETGDTLAAKAKGARTVPFAATVAALGLIAAATDRDADGARHVITSMFAARITPDEQDAVGWLSNRTAVVVPPPGGTVHDLVRAAHRETMSAMDSQRVPLEPAAGAGLSVSVLYLPGRLSGGLQAEMAIGAARARRLSVSFCPTGADVDLLVTEGVRWLTDGTRSRLAVAGIAARARVGEEQLATLVSAVAHALELLATTSWSTPTSELVTLLRDNGIGQSAAG